MSLFDSTIRPPAVLSDEAIERYVAAIRADIDPDPQFRRRLRGIVVNRYVAAREGLAPVMPIRAMGRVGRACLYATFVLGLSVTSVMAASESAIPGDLLYPLKRQIEALRMDVLPAEYHPVLLVHDLGERISELDALVDREDWDRAEALAPVVARDIELLVAAGDPLTDLDPQLAVLDGLVASLPEQARATIVHAIGLSDGAEAPAGGSPSTSGGGAGSPNGGNGPGGPSTGAGDRPSPGQPGDAGHGGSNGQGSGNGSGPANGNGSGNGQGSGSNSGQGNGQGSGSNSGQGNGQGSGSGNGSNGGAPDHAKPSKSPKPGKSSAP